MQWPRTCGEIISRLYLRVVPWLRVAANQEKYLCIPEKGEGIVNRVVAHPVGKNYNSEGTGSLTTGWLSFAAWLSRVFFCTVIAPNTLSKNAKA